MEAVRPVARVEAEAEWVVTMAPAAEPVALQACATTVSLESRDAAAVVWSAGSEGSDRARAEDAKAKVKLAAPMFLLLLLLLHLLLLRLQVWRVERGARKVVTAAAPMPRESFVVAKMREVMTPTRPAAHPAVAAAVEAERISGAAMIAMMEVTAESVVELTRPKPTSPVRWMMAHLQRKRRPRVAREARARQIRRSHRDRRRSRRPSPPAHERSPSPFPHRTHHKARRAL
jgi:hypothetical protein